jgi:outer membrane lipoprotein-sorting protein
VSSVRCCRSTCVTLIIAFAASQAHAQIKSHPDRDRLAKVEKAILEAWSKHRSIGARVETTSRMATEDGGMASQGVGTFEYLRNGRRGMVRLEINATVTRPGKDPDAKLSQSSVTVDDGKHVHALMTFAGRVRALRAESGGEMALTVDGVLAEMRRSAEVSVMPDGKVDNKPVYCLKAVPKKQPTPGYSPSIRYKLYWFYQDSGMFAKFEAHDTVGEITQTTTYTDIRSDIDVSPDRFKLEIPDGVEVTDLTRSHP